MAGGARIATAIADPVERTAAVTTSTSWSSATTTSTREATSPGTRTSSTASPSTAWRETRAASSTPTSPSPSPVTRSTPSFSREPPVPPRAASKARTKREPRRPTGCVPAGWTTSTWWASPPTAACARPRRTPSRLGLRARVLLDHSVGVALGHHSTDRSRLPPGRRRRLPARRRSALEAGPCAARWTTMPHVVAHTLLCSVAYRRTCRVDRWAAGWRKWPGNDQPIRVSESSQRDVFTD